MVGLNIAAEAHALPGDALAQLSACDVTYRRHGDNLRLSAGGVDHDVTLLTYTLPDTLSAHRLTQARSRGLPVLVTASFVSTRLAGRLRDEGLNYIDTAGNASIRLPGLVVEVHGRPRRAESRPRDRRPTGRRTGVKTLLTLLTNPDRAGEMTVRELADAARVSIGSAQATLADLRDDRFLHDGGLDRTGVLFEAWLASYLEDRRLQQPRLRFAHDRGWHRSSGVPEALAEVGGVLGGEDAAEHLGLPLRGSSGIVYAPESIGRLVAAANFRRDPQGTLEVRDIWWRPDDQAATAPTPLIYADLLASDDPRQAEIADELRRTDALLRRLDAH